VCRRVLGDQHKVHVPCQGAPGTYSLLQLKTFAKLPYAVYGFSLGSLRHKNWLRLDKESGTYTLGLRHKGPDGYYIKKWGNERIVVENELRDYLKWEDDHPRTQQAAIAQPPAPAYPFAPPPAPFPPEIFLEWLFG